MAIAGIEGLAQGFMQGMAIKRQNDRQDVLDAQNLERFSMDKERFATQQAASAFDLQNAQTNAANAATDRIRTLRIQKKNDDHEANLSKILGAGTPEGELMELEKIRQGSGVKGAFARDPKTGGLAKNADGTFQWVNEGGSTENVTLEDSIGRYIAEVDPKGEFIRKRTQQDELAKEGREEKTTIAAEERAAKTAKEKDERDYQQAVKLENVKTENIIRAAKAKGALKDPKDYMSKLSQQAFYDVQETIDPYTKVKTYSKPIFNQAKYNAFVLFTHKNDINPDDAAYRLWVSIGNQGQPQPKQDKNSGTDTYDSKSQGKLVPIGLEEVNKADMDDRSPLVLGNQGAAQPASPVSGLTIPRPVPTATYEVPPPIGATRIGNPRIGTFYRVNQSKDMPVPPDGFKRLSVNPRSPDFNVFVSENYKQ